MSDVEKLRALLAEARAAVHLVLDIDALQGWACEAVDDAPPVDDVLRILRDRIDAALAEPVEGPLNAISRLQQQLHEAKSNADWLVQQAQRERDEARAEVERLRSLYLDARTDGWRDGAKAMRAQASGCAAERARYWAETSASEGGVPMMDDRAEEARYIADDIRGLLMPEDKL